MKAIIISEDRLDSIFKATMDRLELHKLRNSETSNPEIRETVRIIHRAFHYQVAQLLCEIKEG